MKMRSLAAAALCGTALAVAAPAPAQAYTGWDYLPADLAAVVSYYLIAPVLPFLPPPPPSPPTPLVWNLAPMPPPLPPVRSIYPQDAPPAAPQDAPPAAPYYENCTAVWNAIERSIKRDEPGFGPHLDADDDGVGCEQDPRN